MSVAANITLVREEGIFAKVTSVVGFPEGFLFTLAVGFDSRRIPFRQLDFSNPRDRVSRPLPARVRVVYADGRAADSSAFPVPAAGPVITSQGAEPDPGEPDAFSPGPLRHQETYWWVSPLPPPGPLDFLVYPAGSAAPIGTGRAEARPVLDAAAKSAAPWTTDGGR